MPAQLRDDKTSLGAGPIGQRSQDFLHNYSITSVLLPSPLVVPPVVNSVFKREGGSCRDTFNDPNLTATSSAPLDKIFSDSITSVLLPSPLAVSAVLNSVFKREGGSCRDTFNDPPNNNEDFSVYETNICAISRLPRKSNIVEFDHTKMLIDLVFIF